MENIQKIKDIIDSARLSDFFDDKIAVSDTFHIFWRNMPSKNKAIFAIDIAFSRTIISDLGSTIKGLWEVFEESDSVKKNMDAVLKYNNISMVQDVLFFVLKPEHPLMPQILHFLFCINFLQNLSVFYED